MRINLATLALAALFVAPLSAAEFSFFSIIRAGLRGNGDWEVGTGPNGSVIPQSAQYNYSQTLPGWPDNTDVRFRIGYEQATNRAYTTVFGWSGAPNTSTQVAYTSSFNPVGAFVMGPDSKWVINANAMYTSVNSALPNPATVTVSNLSLQSGLNVLRPLSETTLTASNRPTVQPSNSGPVYFQAVSNGGNWYIDGTIRFTGLSPYTPNGATRSNAHFGLTISGVQNPEPAAIISMATGLIALALWRRRRPGASA